MCGIVAAVADRNIVPVLLEGLRKLEYRGYDSAGLALINEAGLQRLRAVGRVAELTAQVDETGAAGTTGISHTRWATHGVPCERNAHPHISGGLAVVHNGIIENHEVLRARLRTEGYVFDSDTDTEVVAHLIASELKKCPDFFAATRNAIAQVARRVRARRAARIRSWLHRGRTRRRTAAARSWRRRKLRRIGRLSLAAGHPADRLSGKRRLRVTPAPKPSRDAHRRHAGRAPRNHVEALGRCR